MSGYALAFLSFLVFLVQSSVMPFFFSGLHQPDLWLVVIVLATLIFDNKTAMTLALVGGLLTDLVTGNLSDCTSCHTWRSQRCISLWVGSATTVTGIFRFLR